MNEREIFLNAATAAGCPEDQARNLVAARIWLQERQLAASAAARLCDLPDGPTAIGYGGARGGGKSHWLLAQMGADDCQRVPGLKCLLLRKVGKANLEHFEDLRRRLFNRLPHEFSAFRGILAFAMVVLGNVSITFLLFPFILLVLAPFALGIGLAVSIFNVYLRDVGYLVTIGMNLLFYATPIVYSPEKIPETLWGLPMRAIFNLNPIAHFVEWSRDSFYLLRWPSLTSVAVLLLVSILTFVGGVSVFSWRAKNVTEEL